MTEPAQQLRLALPRVRARRQLAGATGSSALVDLSTVESVTWAWIQWLIDSVAIALTAAYAFRGLGRRR
jgi:hypothetical protein